MTFTQFPVVKVSATGNDFLLVDLLPVENRRLWTSDFATSARPQLARKWCARHEGLGADGLVVLEPHATLDFVWDFYNSDGGSAEMCGNAARAVSLHIQLTQGKSQVSFATRAGEVDARIESAQAIEVRLPAVAEYEFGPEFDFIRAGVPHAVVRTQDLSDRARLREMALKIKSLRRFAQDGVNVTFVTFLSEKNPAQIASVTFERGVEDFTLSCGTGAIAAAFALTRGQENHRVQVQVPGGHLSVVWKSDRPLLRGPAQIVARMHVHL